eukprot:Skav216891  [mRNA]  locus=scaffold1276:123500:127735:+ [translate_table: standard]
MAQMLSNMTVNISERAILLDFVRKQLRQRAWRGQIPEQERASSHNFRSTPWSNVVHQAADAAGLDLPRLKLHQRPVEPQHKAEAFPEEDAGTRKAWRQICEMGQGHIARSRGCGIPKKYGAAGGGLAWVQQNGALDAIESMDYWKLQGAMQAVIGCGLAKDQAPRLKQAMRTHKIRSEAARELRKAAQARDKARLRTAIEGALKVHTEETVVKKARDALRALQAREAARDELRKATAAKEPARLKVALAAAVKVGLHEQASIHNMPETSKHKNEMISRCTAPGMLGADPKEQEECAWLQLEQLKTSRLVRLPRVEAARQELRLHAMARQGA